MVRASDLKSRRCGGTPGTSMLLRFSGEVKAVEDGLVLSVMRESEL